MNTTNSIQIFINGNGYQLPNSCTIADALNVVMTNFQDQCFALALNQTFVAKDAYIDTQLKENDCLDIMKPIQGG